MSTKNDKWVMFRNFMVNELGITKEDIREWINDAVKEEAKKIVQDSFKRENPEAIIKRIIVEDQVFGSDINRNVIDCTAKILSEQFELKLKLK